MGDLRFKVCVSCWTYNHSAWIEDAMNGFCLQETRFPFVCVIVDDHSTDGEQGILNKYFEQHFDLWDGTTVKREETEDYVMTFARHKSINNCYFVVYLLKYNHYQAQKTKTHYLYKWVAISEYVAICEGDDYWIDSLKLQKQVDYLDNHPEVGLVHARAKIFNQESQMFQGICGERNGLFEQILLKNPIVTLTTCYRSSLLKEYVNESAKWGQRGWKMGDYPMWIWMSKRAGVHFMNDVVAVYRQQNNSVTHSGGLENKLAFIDSTVDIRLFFCDHYKLPQKTKNQVLYNAFLSKAANCLARQEKIQAEAYLKKLTILDRWNLKLRFWFHDVRHILNKQKDA